MKKINYKSDFDFKMKLKDCEEKAVPFPDCDWDAVFWTSSKANAYKASCKGGVYANCRREEDGSMRFIFDNQRLGPGSLKWEPHFELPNGIYPSGIQDLFDKKSLDIELVTGAGTTPPKLKSRPCFLTSRATRESRESKAKRASAERKATHSLSTTSRRSSLRRSRVKRERKVTPAPRARKVNAAIRESRAPKVTRETKGIRATTVPL